MARLYRKFFLCREEIRTHELVYTRFERNAVCKSVFLTATALSGEESSKLI